VDENKNVIADIEFTPYGGLYAHLGSDDSARRFTGHEWDPAAHLYATPYGCYDQGISRWTTRDTSQSISSDNAYWYGEGNPVTFLNLDFRYAYQLNPDNTLGEEVTDPCIYKGKRVDKCQDCVDHRYKMSIEFLQGARDAAKIELTVILDKPKKTRMDKIRIKNLKQHIIGYGKQVLKAGICRDGIYAVFCPEKPEAADVRKIWRECMDPKNVLERIGDVRRWIRDRQRPETPTAPNRGVPSLPPQLPMPGFPG